MNVADLRKNDFLTAVRKIYTIFIKLFTNVNSSFSIVFVILYVQSTYIEDTLDWSRKHTCIHIRLWRKLAGAT